MFTTPSVRAVRAKYPDARLYYLTGKYSSFIPEHNPEIDEIMIVEPPFEMKSRLRYLRAFYNGTTGIEKENFDILVCFHRSMLAASLGFFGRVGTIVGFEETSPMADHYMKFDPARHEVLRYLDLVSAIGCEQSGTDLEYRTTPDEDRTAEEMLKNGGIKSEFAVIAPGGGENPGTIMHIKRWPVSAYKRIAAYLKKKYELPVVAAGSQSEKKMCDAISADLNLAGETSFPILASILKKSSIVIANDSGPLYLASAVGSRTVGIYGPSSDELVAPMGSEHRSVKKAVWCHPCYRPENVSRGRVDCKSGTWACMIALAQEKVQDAIDSLFE